MTATIRTFIGLRIAATDELQAVGADLGRLGRGVKVTPGDKLHLTLKFLGETPQNLVGEIAVALREAAASVPNHSIKFIGLGAFPHVARPAVVWAGVQPAGEIERLAAILDRLLEPLGFVPEARPFTPHLTLARVKGATPGVGELVAANRMTAYGEATVEAVELFRSEPTPTGSRYTQLAKAELRAGT